jgi:hypothetical protein
MARGAKDIVRFAPYVSFLLFNIPLVYFRIYESSYDAFTHLFFANHYKSSWFNIWNSKWYGGFQVSGYTPLSHQLMALISWLTGLSYSFGILSLIALLTLIWSVKRLSIALELDSKILPWLVGFSPAFYLFVYIFGQLPGILSTAFLFAGVSYLVYYVRRDFATIGAGKRYLILAALFFSLSFFTNQLIFFLASPLAILSLTQRASLKRMIKGTVLSNALAAVIVSPILFELVKFTISTPPQAPIWHITRGNLVVGSASFPFIWAIYGPLLPLLPLSYLTLHETKKWVIGGVATVYAVFGLGGSTPLPRLILGDAIFNFLTYEKFSLMAALLLSIPVGRYLEDRLPRSYGKRWATRLRIITILSFIIASVLVIHLPNIMPLQPSPPDINAIAHYLNSQPGKGFYITLGIGTWSRWLSILSDHPTLDGGFNSARRLPILAESGVENIDAAKYFPGGVELVKKILSGSYGVRWVVLGDESYIPLLADSGFVQKTVINGTRPITIWENTREGYEKEFDNTLYVGSDQSYFWGLVPILILLFTMSLTIVWRKLN